MRCFLSKGEEVWINKFREEKDKVSKEVERKTTYWSYCQDELRCCCPGIKTHKMIKTYSVLAFQNRDSFCSKLSTGFVVKRGWLRL
jgi:hypothetical protein